MARVFGSTLDSKGIDSKKESTITFLFVAKFFFITGDGEGRRYRGTCTIFE